jgi:hypothetical protein
MPRRRGTSRCGAISWLTAPSHGRGRAGLTPEQVRALFRGVAQVYERLQANEEKQ